MFLIEDEWHAEQIGEYLTKDDAVVELERLSRIPWDHAPNLAPCQSWKTCGRRYELIEYDSASTARRARSRSPMLEVSSNGVVWLP